MSLFGAANPFASITKTIDQFKRGVNDFLEGVETFNKTMESLNGVTVRVNRLLDEVEGPVQAMMPLRRFDCCQCRPIFTSAFFTVSTKASGMFGMIRFCQTVRRTSLDP